MVRVRETGGSSRRASLLKRMSQASPEAAGFGQDLFPCRLIKGQDQFLMLKRCEEGHVIFIIENDDRQRGTQEVQGAGPSFGVELLPTHP